MDVNERSQLDLIVERALTESEGRVSAKLRGLCARLSEERTELLRGFRPTPPGSPQSFTPSVRRALASRRSQIG